MIDINSVQKNAKNLKQIITKEDIMTQARDLFNKSWDIAFNLFDTTEQNRIRHKESMEYLDTNPHKLKKHTLEYRRKQYLKYWDEKGIDINSGPEDKKQFIAKQETHVRPETIRDYIALFGSDLKGIKVLDLGCGTGKYMPLLSIALKELGADVFAIDAKYTPELDKMGIKYENMNLNETYQFEYNPSFFKGNDIIIARSFLGGGLHAESKLARWGSNQKEFEQYKKIIQKVQDVNGKEAIYELDDSLELFFEGENGTEGLTRTFGEKIYQSPETGKTFYFHK